MTERRLRISPWLQGRDLGLTPPMVPSKHSARITRYQQEVMNSKVVTHTFFIYYTIVYLQLFCVNPSMRLANPFYSANRKLQHCYFLLWSEH